METLPRLQRRPDSSPATMRHARCGTPSSRHADGSARSRNQSCPSRSGAGAAHAARATIFGSGVGQVAQLLRTHTSADGFTVLNGISSVGAFVLGLSTLLFIWN